MKLFNFFFSARLSSLIAVAIVREERLVLSGLSTPERQEDFKITASQELWRQQRMQGVSQKTPITAFFPT